MAGACGGRLSGMGARPEGFAWSFAGSDVLITHHGKKATTLRGAAAQEFIDQVETGDAQLLMARLTGNYRRGNERTAKHHPRNR